MNDLVQFRRCLGHFGTGVAVITCADSAGKLCGITANSFSSVSLEPPLVLWNIAKVSRSVEAYLGADHFGINILSAAQESVSANFAQSDVDLFDGIAYQLTDRGVPRLSESLAWFDCRTYETYDCGDHYIIVGEVLGFEAGDGEPLLFYKGRYQRLRDV